MTATCFVTGATGFVGGHVARALATQGWTVRALVRGAASRLSPLLDVGVSPVPGDLSPEADLRACLSGCDAIVHVAGVVKARTLAEYREGNVSATQRLLQWGQRVCPGAMLVFVSSQAAAGPAREGRAVTESDPPRPISWYGISKREAEEAVAREWKGPWVAIRPAVVYGPGDRGLLLLFQAAARGLLPVPAGRSRIQVIFAEQAALAIARAAGCSNLDRRTPFLCDPNPIAIKELCGAMARLSGRAVRMVPVPDLALWLTGAFETLCEALTRRSLAFNADKAREILAGDWLCDGALLHRELDLPPPTPLEDGLARTWQWYKERGWLAL